MNMRKGIRRVLVVAIAVYWVAAAYAAFEAGNGAWNHEPGLWNAPPDLASPWVVRVEGDYTIEPPPARNPAQAISIFIASYGARVAGGTLVAWVGPFGAIMGAALTVFWIWRGFIQKPTRSEAGK